MESLEPDEAQLKSARYVMFKPCPFCGSPAGPLLDYVNHKPMFGSEPIYQTLIACQDESKCGATVRANTRSREESHSKAVERWQRRAGR